jgi:hypothetical protein
LKGFALILCVEIATDNNGSVQRRETNSLQNWPGGLARVGPPAKKRKKRKEKRKEGKRGRGWTLISMGHPLTR